MRGGRAGGRPSGFQKTRRVFVLREVKLIGANMADADLSRANLHKALLFGANMPNGTRHD